MPFRMRIGFIVTPLMLRSGELLRVLSLSLAGFFLVAVVFIAHDGTNSSQSSQLVPARDEPITGRDVRTLTLGSR